MITIVYKKGDIYQQVDWVIGQKSKWLPPVDAVTMVQADGEELDYIYNNTLNFPQAQFVKRQMWHGDLAKFIAGNLIT